MHVSSGRANETDRSHADFITIEDYENALKFANDDFDIMLECKEKDISLLKLLENK
jgi:UV DNA damage endonuclease